MGRKVRILLRNRFLESFFAKQLVRGLLEQDVDEGVLAIVVLEKLGRRCASVAMFDFPAVNLEQTVAFLELDRRRYWEGGYLQPWMLLSLTDLTVDALVQCLMFVQARLHSLRQGELGYYLVD